MIISAVVPCYKEQDRILGVLEKFGDIVNRGGYASPIRTPRGEDISAACGQLKSDTKKVRASEKYKKELAKIESKRIGRL